MTRKVTEWASEHGQVIKLGLSYGRREKSLPPMVVFAYNWL